MTDALREFLTLAGSAIAILSSSAALYFMIRKSRRDARKELAEEAAAAKKIADDAAAKEQARLDAIAEQERVLSEHGLTLEQFRQQVARELLEDLRTQVNAATERATAAEARADRMHERMTGVEGEVRELRGKYETAARQIGEMFTHLDAMEKEISFPPGPPPRPAHWVHFNVA